MTDEAAAPQGQQPQIETREVTEAFKRAATGDVPDAQAFVASPQPAAGAAPPDVLPAAPAGNDAVTPTPSAADGGES